MAEESQQGTGRIALFDNVKGLAIILVVVGHTIGYSMDVCPSSHFAQALQTYLYMFHMPVFILISGMFAGLSWRKHGRAPVDKFLLYLFLYLFLCACVVVLDIVFLGKDSSVNPYVMGQAPWFLLALAIMMLFVPLLGSLPAAPVIVGATIVSVGAGLAMSSPRELSLLRVFTYFPYFAAGFYFTPERVQRCVQAVRARLKTAPTVILAIAALVAVFLFLYFCLDGDQLRNLKRLSTGRRLLTTIAGYTGLPLWQLSLLRVADYFVVTGIIALLFLAMPMGRCPLSTLGERSLQVYIVHILIIYALDGCGFFEWAQADNPYWVLCAIVAGVLLAALLAIPRFPQTWVDKLAAWCKKITTPAPQPAEQPAEASAGTAAQPDGAPAEPAANAQPDAPNQRSR